MKKIFLLTMVATAIAFTTNAQLTIKNDTVFRTADQMLLANELFESGEPFAEALGYNLDLLDPFVLNSPDSIAYTTGIDGYEYSRYLLGTVISRSGIGLHMMWSPMIEQMAAMEPAEFDGSFTGGMINGFKEDDEMMMMVGHFSMLANQMAPMNPFPQFAEFESGNPQLPQTVAPDFAMDFSTLRWDRSKFVKTLNPAAMGQSLWKQYFWAKDMLGAFHDADDNTIEADGIISPDLADSPNFDPANNVFYGGNNLDGFIGQVLTAESVNKVMFLLNNLGYDGNSLGMIDAATYDPSNGIKYFPHKIAVTEGIVDASMPPKAIALEVTDPSSHLFDQVSLLLGALDFKNMMDPSINDTQHYAYHRVFDGDPFPAPMSVSGMMGPYDMMAGISMVLFQNIMAMHFDMAEGTFVDVSDYTGGTLTKGNLISSENAGYTLLALSKVAREFAGMSLEQMATDALNAQANFVLNQLKDVTGGYYNAYTTGTGPDYSPKSAIAQAATARGLYAAYQLTNNTAYLDGANAAYNFLIDNFYVASENVFRTEYGNKTANYTPVTLAILAGGLREAAIVGNQTDAQAIYTRFFNKIYNPMLLAEAEVTGESGSDSDGDGIPYVAGGKVATVFVSEAEYTLATITSVNKYSGLDQNLNLNIYPNPVRESASVDFNTPVAGIIHLSILDMLGREVQMITDDNTSSGKHSVTWDTGSLKNGIYFVQLSNNQEIVATKKVIINK